MALLETFPVGTTVKIAENGTLAEYLIVHIGLPDSMYDANCDGIWMLRKDLSETRQWHSSNVNDWANSTLKAYLDSTFLNRFDANVKNVVKTVKIPYRPGSGASMTVSSGANGLSCKVFLLSGYEVGFTTSVSQYFPVDGAKLSYFIAGNDVIAQAKRVANLNGRAADWWLRSPYTNSSASEWRVGAGGNFGFDLCSSARGVRPAIILPPDLPVEMQEDGSFNIVPNNTSARKIVDGVELPAASLKTVGGIDLECDCYKIIDGIELVCT